MTPGNGPAPSADDLPQLVRRGTGIVFAAQVATQAIALVTLACLARLVPAEAFGVIGIALPIVMLPRIAATLGFSTTAIQDAEGDHGLLTSLFWRAMVWSLLGALAPAIAGVLLANLCGLPSLALVAPALAVGTVLNAFSVVQLAVLERRLQLQRASLIRLAAQTFASAAAIIAAWQGYGVWALVTQQVGEMLVLALGAWLFSPWRPSLYHFALPIESRRFGGYFALSSLLFYLAQNVDKLLLAAWLGSSPRAQALVGMYAQAYNLMTRPVYFVTTPLSSIMLPTLARTQHNAAAFADWTERFYRLTALLLLPAGVGLCLVAPDLMPLLAPNWPESGTLLAILAPVILALGFINIAGSVLAASRRSGVLCLAALVQLIVLAQAVWGGASFAASDYQLTATTIDPSLALYRQTLGAAAGVSCLSLLLVIPYTAVVFYLTGVPLVRFFRALKIALPAAAAMGVGVFLVQQALLLTTLPAPWRLTLEVATGIFIFGLLTLPAWRALLRSSLSAD